jgi:cyclopropane-fatty-acyl-phospholipid synthase
MEQVMHKSSAMAHSDRHRTSVYERIVLNLFEGMTQGHMRLTLQNGETRHLGDPNSPFKATVRVVRDAFFRKCVLYGDVGFGESYVDGDWETDNITAVIQWFLLNVENAPTLSGSKRKLVPGNILKVLNRLYHKLRSNNLQGSRKNISEHYDLSNQFFELFLDRSMTYSSGFYVKPEVSLEEAQIEKYDRLCRKLKLQPADHLLEIGSGWGGFAVHAARNYGCRITTVTISREQFEYAQERFRREGLDYLIDIKLADYRTLTGSYDKIVSIEMLEAVGHEFLETYFATCHNLLKKNGVLAFQVITCADSRYDSLRKNVDWIQKHIFPGSLLPSVGALNKAINRTGDMVMQQMEEFGLSYARTLAEWKKMFNSRLDQVRTLGFDERFIRKWNYYLSYCEGAFAMRNISVVQMVYTRPNNLSY